LRKFLDTGPKERRALARVHLAYTQLNADETQNALELLEDTVRSYPKDPASFRASYLLGIAHLEHNDLEQAQSAFRKILESDTLKPAAKEWRDSLFALGSTLYHANSANIARNNEWEQRLANARDQAETHKSASESNLGNWDESIGKLSEYVRRYPGEDRDYEAQYLLSRAYQKSANAYHAKLENAQIANEKQELAKEYHQRLKIASGILRDLRAQLLREEEALGLDPFQARLLQNTFFDLGDIAFATQEYEEAILTYSSAINRYPNHVRVLLSYLQMAKCYQQVGKPDEARSTLKQAQILSQRMGDATFQSASTSHKTRQEWTDWFDWTLQMLGSPQ
jgi:TolA-binding protein